MTTNPKAPTFRVSRAKRTKTPPEDIIEGATARSDAQASTPPAQDNLFAPGPESDGLGEAAYPGSAKHEAQQQRTSRGAISDALGAPVEAAQTPPTDEKTDAQIDAEIDAIKNEGLTGRQLRNARRLARQHDMDTASDFDAVRQLRAKDIDPFKGPLVLSKIQGSANKTALSTPQESLLSESSNSSATLRPEVMERLTYANDIAKIQQDIAKRRQRKAILLAGRLFVFVGLPTLFCGIYFYTIATPMYATNSSFIVQQAEAAGVSGGLFSGTSFGGSQDSTTVQDYLEGRNAMLRLDQDLGFKEHFSSESIDPLQRLPEAPSNEKAYKTYSKRVQIGYDPTEGLVKMEVVASDPETSFLFSEALIKYAEEHVDQQTQRKREDQMRSSVENLSDAETNMRSAQESVIDLQEQLGILSPEAETSALMSQVSSLESQLLQKELELQQLLDNSRPNQARVQGVEGDIRRTKAAVADLRSQMTDTQGDTNSMARINAELSMAAIDLQTRQMMVQQAIQTLEASRMEANRQTRFLALSSSPVIPDEARYPRKFENTILSFLVFSGIFLLVSLTAAVLREQLSA
jgi:capsular polysaccharide transport system permease protein